MDEGLKEYARKFSMLRRGTTKYGPAPHKPILLLAVLQGIQEGWISENRIELSPELAGAFRSIWQNLVTTGHSPLIAQPFFYMRSEIFWNHVPNFGYEKWVEITKNCQSIGVLHQAIAYAQLDAELFMLASSPAHRSLLSQTLIESYFPNAQADTIGSSNYCDEVSCQILADSSAEYQAEMLKLREQLDRESFEEEVFVRRGVFKREVPLVYNNTCCISGLRIETNINASLVDACHIVPFSQSHDDTISNGLALCPTLHRAFDRGLIAIDPDSYSVLVSKRFSEPVKSAYSIRQFAGQQIQLPKDRHYFPGKENLQEHLDRHVACF